MANPPEHEPGAGPEAAGESSAEAYPPPPSDADTTVINLSKPAGDPVPPDNQQQERRFTAPGFDAKETQVIATTAEPATEVIHTAAGQTPPPAAPPQAVAPPKAAVPQSIPPRDSTKAGPARHFSWGWVLAIVVIVLALAAIAVLGTMLLARSKHPPVSQEDQVRSTIQSFDAALQTGDLSKLRSMTCGTTRDGYVDYDERAWDETYHRVAAAKQLPVIASIDQVVVNGQHAEANVTTFMAYDPALRSTRSIDLQFRDDQWKVCQSPTG